MPIPQVPTPDPDLTREQALHMILSSIAMEEIALSKIMNAESANLTYILKQNEQIGCCHTNDILAVNKSVTELLEMVMQNQLILKNKMEKVLTALPHSTCCPEPCKECCPEPCIECCPEPCTESCLEPYTECCPEPCTECCSKDVYTCCRYRWSAKQPLPWTTVNSHISRIDGSFPGAILLKEGQYALRFWMKLSQVPREDILFAFKDCWGNTVFPSHLRLQCPRLGSEITGSSTISISPGKSGCISLHLLAPSALEVNCTTLRIEAI